MKKGLFGQVTVRETDSDELYAARLNRSASLFTEEDTVEDDTRIDDLELATELLTHQQKEKKVWSGSSATRRGALFEDEKEEVETNPLDVTKTSEEPQSLPQSLSSTANEEEDFFLPQQPAKDTKLQDDADSITLQVESLLQKLSTTSSTPSIASQEISSDFDVSAYISQNSSAPARGLFD